MVEPKKKDGPIWLCINYRQHNKKIIKGHYPLPLIEDQLDKIQGTTVFTTLDLKNVFFHVPFDKSSVKYTPFATPDGHFECLKTLFGLCIAIPVF